MRHAVTPFAVALLACTGAHAAPTLAPVTLGELRVTEGRIEPGAAGGLAIDAPKVRAVVGDVPARSVEMKFRFLGPTREIAPLSDGEDRQQLGLKLAALDGCNVVYVMWRIEPRSQLAVQVKRNPGLRTSAECGARGYRKLPVKVALPRLEPGAAHTLRADLEGEDLSVFVDGTQAWRGSVGDLQGLTGPVGLRTDNVRLELELSSSGRVQAGVRP